MARPRDSATLREAVRSSGFTPSTRDMDGLVELLGDPEEAVVRGSEQAIVRAASGGAADAVVRLLASLEQATPASRARGFRVVGQLAPRDEPSARALIAGLADTDARVQRAAAHALGRLRESDAAKEIASALLAKWDEVPELPLARAVAEALGKLGVAEARERLTATEGGDAELSRIASKSAAMLKRDASRGEESEVVGDVALDVDVELVLACRGGLEAIVRGELLERCPGARPVGPTILGSGEVRAHWRGAPSALMSMRTMLDFGFALPAERVQDEAAVEAACVRSLASETARQILEPLTRGAVRYRLEWEGKGHRRGATWRVVHALTALRPAWVNDPTSSTWNASVRVARGEVRVLLTPRRLADPRFLYRLGDVPAASHPTIAAALVRASGCRDDDVVWDPFVGSGSELVERAKAGPYRRLIGSDLDGGAIATARRNFEAAGVAGVILQLADATLHSPDGVTQILTNPPMGRRVARDGSLADLLDRFTDQAAKVLVPGGRLTWLSPLGGRTAARAEAIGLRVVLRQSVDMGGFHAELQHWQKP